MKLNNLRADGWNSTKWCGPTALALITGRTLKFCHNKLARIEGKEPRYLKGVYKPSMRRALQEMGYQMERINFVRQGMTLRKYIEEVQTTEHFRGVMLVNVTRHYVVISKGMVVDNHSIVPLPVRKHPMRRKRIKNVWIVKKK
jgi:hypothetical protein|tara:strand:+ start:364 stop:792 length:429 start_codon:yes stop_codon:yes gene_type:complete